MKNYYETKLKYLNITLRLWQWLAKNPGKLKRDWTGWDKFGGPMLNQCPCCEFTLFNADGIRDNKFGGDNCQRCPLKEEFELQTTYNTGEYYCENDDTCYEAWKIAIARYDVNENTVEDVQDVVSAAEDMVSLIELAVKRTEKEYDEQKAENERKQNATKTTYNGMA